LWFIHLKYCHGSFSKKEKSFIHLQVVFNSYYSLITIFVQERDLFNILQ